ncbi:MAG: D-alanyl-D-alanine carboxypeptidase/D-alanyl-D-alanine-endopeptidase, partial [Acidobacteriota bacterium]|nr:D-alanyl-D-alanine carboxypeptidase/D-alanyl-D-alanine-endopeptidase [Acidobacteriota bacterium]
PTPAAPRTPEELAARIRQIIARPEFAASQLAVKVASLDTGRVLFEENARKWMQPASNLKLFTVAAALDRFGPDYRFVTSVYAPAPPDPTGTLRGDLTVYGRGDPTFATRFNPEGDNDYYRAVDELAARAAASGLRRVEGDLVGDESYFAGLPLAFGWEWDDLQWWYGAEVSALSVNDNSVDLSVRPGARVGDPCQISVGPVTPLVTVVDRTRTSPRGTKRELDVHRPLGQNVLEVSGSLPLDDRGYTASVAVTNPALMFATMFRQALERRGVTFTGRTRTVNWRERARAPLDVSALVELATRQSPPLSVIAAQTLKPSQNLYTELLLRALGKASATDPKQWSDQAGVAAVKNFLRGAGVEERQLNMLDGSGLSRGNLVTADAVVRLLVHMNRHRHGAAFRAALPVAGVDGTLRNRMRGTPAASNLRAKTGTLSSSTTLAGYLFTAAGERLVFSLMINNPPRDTDPRTGFTDAVAVLLASFAGRS